MDLLGQRVLLIANPGSRRGGRSVDAALSAFRRCGIECDAMLTEYPGHAGELASRNAGRYGAVFALGGDGTVMDVLGALGPDAPPLGILPGGTGNLIARALGIPRGIRRAVRRLLGGELARIDLGRLDDGRRFAFAAGIGIDATMVERTPARLKRRIGMLAYALTATSAVLRNEAFDVRVTVDGVVHERRGAMVMVTNFGTLLDRLIVLGPGIRQDDGLLDLCVFSPGSIADAARIAWRLMRRDFRMDPCVLYASGRHFRVETNPLRRVQADGELLGSTPFEVHVEPLAAVLIVPRND